MDRGKAKSVRSNIAKLFFIVCDTAARAAECECRTDNYGVADNIVREINSVFKLFNDLGRDTRLADLFHSVLECLSVLSLVNGFGVSTEELYTVGFEEAFLCKLHGKRKTRLSAECGKNAVRLFDLNDLLYNIKCERFNINLVSHCLIGHNCCRVGVDEYNFKTLLLKRTASLSACIVKFGSLTDNDRT